MKKIYLKLIAVVLLCWTAMGAQAQVASEEKVNYGKESLPIHPDFNAMLSASTCCITTTSSAITMAMPI